MSTAFEAIQGHWNELDKERARHLSNILGGILSRYTLWGDGCITLSVKTTIHA